VALLEPTDALWSRGNTKLALTEVLRLAGRADDAAQAARDALAEFERKGNVVMAGRVKAFVSELDEG
jgi:hypothetical protein